MRNALPGWIRGSKRGNQYQKVLRLTYWRNGSDISYVVMRMEVDAKERPKFYELVLGARKQQTAELKLDQMRKSDMGFLYWLRSLFK